MDHWPDVSLLITHYNRSDSLARLLQALRRLDVHFGTVVVADDGSRPEHQSRLNELQAEFGFLLVTTPENRGLGHNLNKGHARITTPYTLYVQEDFIPAARFPQKFREALALMADYPDVDLIRFYNHDRAYPHLRPLRDGFSEMVFSVCRPGVAKFFIYSDTPHLRRASFGARFGRYAEGVRAIKCEKAMVMSFLQAHGKCLISDTNDLFAHENTHTEPSTQDYSGFFRLKRLFPQWLFALAWTLKLTLQYWLVTYRHPDPGGNAAAIANRTSPRHSAVS